MIQAIARLLAGLFTFNAEQAEPPLPPAPAPVISYVSEGNALASGVQPTVTTTTQPQTSVTPEESVWTTPAVCADIQTYVTMPLPGGFEVSCSESYGYSSFNGTEIRLIWRDNMDVGTATCLYAHELGHVYDSVYLDDAERKQYAETRGYPIGSWTETRTQGANWWWDGQWGNGRSPGEDFADSFANAIVPNPTEHYCVRSYGGDDMTTEQTALLWSLV